MSFVLIINSFLLDSEKSPVLINNFTNLRGLNDGFAYGRPRTVKSRNTVIKPYVEFNTCN